MKSGSFLSLLAIALLVSACPCAFAQETRQPLTPRMLWEINRVGIPVSSPDGNRATFVVTTYDVDENQSKSNLFLLSGDASPLQLTSSESSDDAPAWSPDGRHIAFVSKRSGSEAQLFVIGVDGGEAQQVTKLPVAVSHPRWFPDGRRIAFLADVPPGFSGDFPRLKEQLEERRKKKVNVRVTENRIYRYWDTWFTDGDYPRLFSLEVETGKVTDLMPGSSRYFNFEGPEYSISPDGKEIALSLNTTKPPYDTTNLDIVLLRADGSGQTRSLTSANLAPDLNPVYSPDGRYIVYGEQRRADFYADRVRLVRLDRQSGSRLVLTEDTDLSAEQWVFARDGQLLYFHAESKGGKALYSVPCSGGRVRELYRGGTNDGISIFGDKKLLMLHQTLSEPAEIFQLSSDGSGLRKRTSFNDTILAKVKFGRVEDVSFKGADGADIQMFVVYPPDFDPSRKWPLVLIIHGGPYSSLGDLFHFRQNAHLFAAPGYVIAIPHFHGSTGFGQDFAISIHGSLADKPFRDVMAATDYMISRGFIDEKRMAAAGASYGGYLISWIAGSTDRYAALVNHAGVSDVMGDWASDYIESDPQMYGGSPWERTDILQRSNPITKAANFHTPMLILHGELDFRVTVDLGLEIYGIYKARGLEARLVYFPDEHHWILKPQNSIFWNTEVHNWLKRYLSKGR